MSFFRWAEDRARRGLWDFITKEPRETVSREAAPAAEKREARGRIRAVAYVFEPEGAAVERTLVTVDERAAFLLEEIRFDRPRVAHSYFDLALTGDLNVNVADRTRLVFRRGGDGMKWFRLVSETDGNDTLSSCGLLLPAGFPDGETMRVSAYSGLYHYGLAHETLHVFITGDSGSIARWHVQPTEDGFGVFTPEKALFCGAAWQNGVLTVRTGDGADEIVLDKKETEREDKK